MVRARDGRVALSATGEVAAPSPAFWAAARVVLRRVRIGCYGAGSMVFAAALTGGFAFKLAGWATGVGMFGAVILCQFGLLFEVFENYIGKGGSHEDE